MLDVLLATQTGVECSCALDASPSITDGVAIVEATSACTATNVDLGPEVAGAPVLFNCAGTFAYDGTVAAADLEVNGMVTVVTGCTLVTIPVAGFDLALSYTVAGSLTSLEGVSTEILDTPAPCLADVVGPFVSGSCMCDSEGCEGELEVNISCQLEIQNPLLGTSQSFEASRGCVGISTFA